MSTQLAKMPLRQVDSVKKLLHNDEAKHQLAAVAAGHLKPERMMRVTANAIRTTPKLQECDPLSFLGALMQCASLGLEPNTVMGHAYLVPFRNNKKGITEVQVIVGYKGLIDLARRSGHITSISANIHYSDDPLWEYEEGTEARLRHQPGPQEGEKLHAYAIAKFRDGGHAYVVLPWKVVMKIRDGSQNWQTAVKYNSTGKSPWSTHEDAMAKKTAIRALSKYLPLSVEFMDAVTIDNDSGARVDYAQMALNPNDGPAFEDEPIEGTAEDVDEGAKVQTGDASDTPKENLLDDESLDKPKSKAKPKETKAADKSKPDPKPKQVDAEEKEPEPELDMNSAGPSDEEAFAKLEELILGEIAEATTPDEVDAVMDLYADQIGPMEGSGAFDRIHDAAKARRAETA